MKIRKIATIAATAVATGALALALAGCGGSSSGSVQISVPSDATNEARALLLLQDQGLITLTDGVGLAATANDIQDNPYNIELVEAEAAAVSRTLQDVDFGVINGNYALSAGLSIADALASEDADSDAAQEFGNVIAVRADDVDSPKTQALLAALETDTAISFINDTYQGSVVALSEGGAEIPEATGDDTTIVVGATPTPHAEILNAVAPLLAEKGWTLEVVEYQDYVQPNVALAEGDLDANYFQHQPYLDDYNAENGTDLVGVQKIHFEPLGLYAGKTASLDDIK